MHSSALERLQAALLQKASNANSGCGPLPRVHCNQAIGVGCANPVRGFHGEPIPDPVLDAADQFPHGIAHLGEGQGGESAAVAAWPHE